MALFIKALCPFNVKINFKNIFLFRQSFSGKIKWQWSGGSQLFSLRLPYELILKMGYRNWGKN